jgi:superoxide dismutase
MTWKLIAEQCKIELKVWSIYLFQDDLSGRQKPRSFSLSSEHAPPLSPQSSLASSGSGSLDELHTGFSSDACGMRGECWLLLVMIPGRYSSVSAAAAS